VLSAFHFRVLPVIGELLHEITHVLFGHTVAIHHQPDEWVSQQASQISLIV
jgi:hypothetical protein